MLAARRREEPPNKFLDAGVDVAAIKCSRTNNSVRGTRPPRDVVGLLGILLIQTPRAASRHNSSLLVVVAGPRLRALEFGRRWPSVLGLEPLEEGAARGLARRVPTNGVERALQREGRGLRNGSKLRKKTPTTC